MTSLERNLANREVLLSRLRAEVVGPDPAGKPLALVDKQPMSWEEFRIARRQLNGEEIVWQDPPTKRFGAGILFPQGADELLIEAAAEAGGVLPTDSTDLPAVGEQVGESVNEDQKTVQFNAGDDTDEEGVTLANSFRPSAIGLSFLADFGQESQGICVELVSIGRIASDRTIEGPCGTYRPIVLNVGGAVGKQASAKKVWLREPVVDAHGNVPRSEIGTLEILKAVKPIPLPIPGSPGLELVVVARRWPGAPSTNHRLITVSVVNIRKATHENLDVSCLFQAGLKVSGLSGCAWIDAYPDYIAGEFHDPDELADENVNRVLYRRNRTFAIGHGCGTDWIEGRPERVSCVWSDVLPVFETPSTSADLVVVESDGSRRSLRISMRLLAGLGEGQDGLDEADRLVEEYSAWINGLASMLTGILKTDRPTATALIEKCRECAVRIRAGIDLLRSDSETADLARKAFRLANHSMLIAQLRTRQPLRTPVKDANGRISWNMPMPVIEPSVPSEIHGYWRPFQIAFLLMSLKGVVDDTHIERSTVDLIWFPTGGGKTEAYLGLTAFTVFFNALSGVETTGVDVLMRYTLRLLTAQQFQRAATLFCAMEQLRLKAPFNLGKRPFRIGLWVGGSATPNKRSHALEKLRDLQRDPNAENPYVLLRCPWCASKFGPHEFSTGGAKSGKSGFGWSNKSTKAEVLGYSKERIGTSDTVVFRCRDVSCEYGGLPGQSDPPLPIVVIDEDLLESP